MSDIGVEVGQKMRSAIKAKLMELECYVDDELPDYIMVMVANKRTKSQMNEDLQLFLGSKTATFVEWLHIVLKKLKEVHVTNPNVFNKKTTKRKIDDPDLEKHIKKEKKDFKGKKQIKKEDEFKEKSLTDDLPMNITKLSECRKVSLQYESATADSFDIPTISEVNSSSEAQLQMIERQIKSAKSRLGVVVDSGSDEEFLNLKAEPDDLFPNEQSSGRRQKMNVVNESLTPPMPVSTDRLIELPERTKNREHSRIIFDLDNNAPKKKSALERLGKRRISEDNGTDFTSGKKRVVMRDHEEKDKTEKKKGNRKDDQLEIPKRESALLRLGVMSKVAIPLKKSPEPVEEDNLPTKEVPSVVKVKPRVIPANTPQANKNLLLKAVADAQRSIAQTPPVGTTGKPDALYTKKYKGKVVEKLPTAHTNKRKLHDKQKSKLQAIISHISKNVESTTKNAPTVVTSESEYVSKSSRKPEPTRNVEYIPIPKAEIMTTDKINFIITLDGIDKAKFEKIVEEKPLPEKKRKSPIIFDKVNSLPSKKVLANVPDVLPKVHAPPQLKNKERCKYWPACRQGEKCEFAHPSTSCKMFPQCKFGDKCLYVHPSCKFESSCTRRDCPYSHVSMSKSIASRITPSAPSMQSTKASQVCKFYPNCTNSHCAYYHPRPCKFGKFCKNQLGCTFSHPKTANLTWRSDLKT